jgi:hypothetical protein
MNVPITLSEAVDHAVQDGFTYTFKAEATGLRCLQTGDRFDPSEVTIVGHERFEGASSAGDNAALYRVETSNGLRGTIVDAYGADADQHLAEFLRATPVDED